PREPFAPRAAPGAGAGGHGRRGGACASPDLEAAIPARAPLAGHGLDRGLGRDSRMERLLDRARDPDLLEPEDEEPARDRDEREKHEDRREENDAAPLPVHRRPHGSPPSSVRALSSGNR